MKAMIMLAIAGVAGVILTVKTAQAQTAPWLQPFDYQGQLDEAVDVAVDVYGNSYVVGYGTSNQNQGKDIVVLKYDRNGGFIGGPWVWNGSGNSDDVPVRIHVDRRKKPCTPASNRIEWGAREDLQNETTSTRSHGGRHSGDRRLVAEFQC
ncbi:MAG: hypothetical protein AB1725_03450 [Armatimonadota bacterium]